MLSGLAKKAIDSVFESVEDEIQSLSHLGVRQVDRVDVGDYCMVLLHNTDDDTYEVALTSNEQPFTTAKSQEKRPPQARDTNKKKAMVTLVAKLQEWLSEHSPLGVGTMNQGRSRKYHALLGRVGFAVGPIEHVHDPSGPFRDYWTFQVHNRNSSIQDVVDEAMPYYWLKMDDESGEDMQG